MSYNIIYHSNYPWSDMYSRYICLALALSKNSLVNKLVFLEPPVHIGDLGGIKEMIKTLPSAGRYHRNYTQPFDIWAVVSPIPLRRFNLFKRFNNVWENYILNQVRSFIPSRNKVALLQGPSKYTLKMLKFLKQKGFFTIFDWGNLYEKDAGPVEKQDEMAWLCREMARNANIVLGVSPHITNIALSVNSNSFTILDAVLKDMVLREPISPRPKEQRLKCPLIGYFGLINKVKLDYSLIKDIVEKRPGWEFVFIGLQQDNSLSVCLKGKQNVTFMQPMDGETLQQYLVNNIDLVFVPYTQGDEVIRASSPLKLYESLALGLPTVFTDSFDPLDAKCLIQMGGSAGELIELMEKELREDSIEKRTVRIEYARRNTWEIRAEQVLSLINSAYPKFSQQEDYSINISAVE